MKINILNTLILLVFQLCTMSFNNRLSAQNSNIIGTWVCETDDTWRLVFKSDGKCYQYSEGTLLETDLFLISNTSPQCGYEVNVNINTNYLQLSDTQDTTNIVCYEIYGLTDKTLTIRPIDRGGFSLFLKDNRANCDPSLLNYDPSNCLLNPCDHASPNYDANVCANVCDSTSENYNADYCAASRCDPTSTNYNLTNCNARLATLVPSVGVLNPTFKPYHFNYTLTINNTDRYINFNFSRAKEKTIVMVNDTWVPPTVDDSETIDLETGITKIIISARYNTTITVINEYVITILRGSQP